MGNLRLEETITSTTVNAQQLRLFVGSWNVGGRAPTRDTVQSMQEWLNMGSQPAQPAPDIYVIGFQEIVPLNAGNVLGMNRKHGRGAGLSASNKWEALISATLNKSPVTKNNNTIYYDTHNKNEIANSVLKKFSTAVSSSASCTSQASYEDDDNSDAGDDVASHDQHHGGNSAKSHYQYDGKDNTTSHDHCNVEDADNKNDASSDDDYTDGVMIDYTDGVMIDKHDYSTHSNVPRHGCYRSSCVANHTHACTTENDAIPSSASDECRRIYPQAPSTRNIFSLVELDSDLCCDERADICMYTKIARKQMVGVFISVWVRRHLRHHVKAVQVSSVGCGIMNRLGNKGAVSVSLSVHETSFCFICSHLRSGNRPSDVSRRNTDVCNILRRTKFLCSENLQSSAIDLNLPRTILAHDRIIWLGDLNYRLTLPPMELKKALTAGDWEALLEKDELKREKGVGGVFEGWHEGSICFAPTYKYRINSDTYCMVHAKEGSNTRAPAWCDRILWHGKGLKQLSYARCESKHSDHRPVRSIFAVVVESLKETSRLHANHVKNQSITPFLAKVKELLSTTSLNVKQISLHDVKGGHFIEIQLP